jgi:cysteine desulfurase
MTPDVHAGVYLDAGTAEPLRPEAREAMIAAASCVGDPLMIHRPGRQARELLDDARWAVADAISAQPDEVIFTSGGTESIALAIRGAVTALRRPARRIVVGAIEHPAVLGAAKAVATGRLRVVTIPVEEDGRIDVDALAREVRAPGTALVSLQHANHEIGTLQPVAEVARLAREAGARFHTDACQTVGRLPVDVRALGVDLLSLSARTFGGPPGVGALFVRRGIQIVGHPAGDERERKRRAGTQNLPGIAGMAAALTASLGPMADRAAVHWALSASLRERIAADVRGATVHGHPTQRVPHLVCFSVAGVDPATMMMALDDRGFHVGVGSPSTGRPEEPSPVLEQVGTPATASVRVGLGADTTPDDLDRFMGALRDTVSELRRVEEASAEALARFRGSDHASDGG